MVPVDRKYCSIISGGIDSTIISKLLENIADPSFFISLNHVGKDNISNQINKFQKFFKKEIKVVNVSLDKYYFYLKKSLKICSSPINSHDFPGKLIMANEVKKRNCKAIFGGDAADELFGGYSTYSANIKNYNSNSSDYSRYIKNKIKLTSVNELRFKNKLSVIWKIVKKPTNFLERMKEVAKQ